MQTSIPNTILGRNVWRLRGWWNWSVARLANEAHVPTSLVRMIENDKGDPKLSQIHALAEALKVNLWDLVKPGAELVSVSQHYRERISRKIRQGKSNECWLWIGAKRGSYGIYQMDGDRCYPHRLVYAMEKLLMMNWDLDHTCKNRLCVNPEHLKVVTRGTNLYWRDRRRGVQERKQ